MKKRKIALLSILSLGLFITSCNKHETVPMEPYKADLNSYYENNRAEATQTFSLDAGIWNTITGDQGTKIMIPANSFVYASGTPVSGTIEISLLEILDQSDMILMNAETVSDGEILISGGELKVTASAGGTPVYLANGSSIYVQVPTDNPDPQMDLFSGTENSDGTIDWSLSVDSTGTQDSVGVVVDSSGGTWGDYYYFEWDDPNLGWINCDYFSGYSDLTTFTVYVQDDHTFLNTNVFLHFSSINSVATMWGNYTDPAQQTFTTYSIPEGIQLTIVCISEISGDYFSAFVPVTVSANHTETLTLTPTTLADFEAALLNL